VGAATKLWASGTVGGGPAVTARAERSERKPMETGQ
jgi:hypothetical protein